MNAGHLNNTPVIYVMRIMFRFLHFNSINDQPNYDAAWHLHPSRFSARYPIIVEPLAKETIVI